MIRIIRRREPDQSEVSWQPNLCDECGGGQKLLVLIGDSPEWGNRWQTLCEGCLGLALNTLREEASRQREQP